MDITKTKAGAMNVLTIAYLVQMATRAKLVHLIIDSRQAVPVLTLVLMRINT